MALSTSARVANRSASIRSSSGLVIAPEERTARTAPSVVVAACARENGSSARKSSE